MLLPWSKQKTSKSRALALVLLCATTDHSPFCCKMCSVSQITPRFQVLKVLSLMVPHSFQVSYLPGCQMSNMSNLSNVPNVNNKYLYGCSACLMLIITSRYYLFIYSVWKFLAFEDREKMSFSPSDR